MNCSIKSMFSFLFLAPTCSLNKDNFLFFEQFDSIKSTERWTNIKTNFYTGEFSIDLNSKNITATTNNSYHFIISQLSDSIIFDKNKNFVLQFEVFFPISVECSGAYIKLFDDIKLDSISNETNYIIMFGPDKCGDKNIVHFIFNFYNKKSKSFEKKQMTLPPKFPIDNNKHIYTLEVYNDNSFLIKIDRKIVKSGNLLTDFYPPVNMREIPDPNDTKPDNWDEDEYIPDLNAKKPDNWVEEKYIIDSSRKNPPRGWEFDEPEFIPDPANSEKPSDWDDDIFGEWSPPMIPNPKCRIGCGEYHPPIIENPDYIGEWEQPMIRNINYRGKYIPKMIPNQFYYEEKHPCSFHSVSNVGFELWVAEPGVSFGNIVISHNITAVNYWSDMMYSGFSTKNTYNRGYNSSEKMREILEYEKNASTLLHEARRANT